MPAVNRDSRVSSPVMRYVLLLLPIAVLLAAGVTFLYWRSTPKPVRQIRAIVVLPFENRAGDSNQYLADGITNRLISELGRVSAVRVISRTSAMSLGQRKYSIPEVAHRLAVDVVIEGSMVRIGDQIRITTQLNEGASGVQLWKREDTIALSSAFQLANDIAHDIASQINAEPRPQGVTGPPDEKPRDPDVQNLYLQGQYFLNRGSPDHDQEAVGYFQKAIDKDPSFAQAYASLAAAYTDLGQSGLMNYAEAYRKAKNAATKAIELNERLADGHAALADALVGLDWDWAAAEVEYRRALELNPSSSSAHFEYSRHLAKMGRLQESISEAETGLKLDPISPFAYHVLAYTLYSARRYDQALEAIRNAAELNLLSTSGTPMYWDLGVIYVEKGNYQKAIDEFQVIGELPHALGHMGNAYARAGQTEKANQMISKLRSHVKKNGVGNYEIAIIYTGLGQKDQAFAWLERAYKVRDKGLTFMKFDPCVDPLRSDPRFADLLRRVGLAG